MKYRILSCSNTLHLFFLSVIFMRIHYFVSLLVDPLCLSVTVHTVGLHVAAGHIMNNHHGVMLLVFRP